MSFFSFSSFDVAVRLLVSFFFSSPQVDLSFKNSFLFFNFIYRSSEALFPEYPFGSPFLFGRSPEFLLLPSEEARIPPLTFRNLVPELLLPSDQSMSPRVSRSEFFQLNYEHEGLALFSQP